MAWDRITKVKGEGFFHQILTGFEAKDRFSFKVKIIETKNRAIIVGIACISCVRIIDKKDISLNSDHIAAYGNGYKWPKGEGKYDNGFRKGDIVETIVDLDKGEIKWRVNDTQQISMVSKHFQFS